MDLLSRNERLNQLYDDAFYSVGATNCQVKAQVFAHIPDQFQTDPNPPHQPPARYPDLRTVPGVVGVDPATSVRRSVLQDTIQRDLSDPSPMDVDSVVVQGSVPRADVTQAVLSNRELFKRAFGPKDVNVGPATTAW
jgi:hypothetical protein